MPAPIEAPEASSSVECTQTGTVEHADASEVSPDDINSTPEVQCACGSVSLTTAAAEQLEDASAVVYEHSVRTSTLLVMPPKPDYAVHRALSNRFLEFWCRRASPSRIGDSARQREQLRLALMCRCVPSAPPLILTSWRLLYKRLLKDPRTTQQVVFTFTYVE